MMRIPHQEISCSRRAFTLVEVLLAVALSTMVVAAIASLTYQNTRVLHNQQVAIERSQISRSVLTMMKSDCRAIIQHKPADVSALDDLNVSQANILAGLAGVDPNAMGDMGGLADMAGDAGGDPTGATGGSTGGGNTGGGNSGGGANSGGAAEEEAESPDAEANQNISSSGQTTSRPGLYGNSTEIMIDISRLPRVDQYDPIVNQSEGEISLPTDIKTVAYFVSDRQEESYQMQVGEMRSTGGLYRRELDRAVASYSADLAGTIARLGSTKLVAKEVVALRFRYFDGEEWRDEWNSETEGGFPTAIEISITVDNQSNTENGEAVSLQERIQRGFTTRTVAYLPVAEILSQEELDLISGASQ